MPLTGTRDLSALATQAPVVPGFDTERWQLPGAAILQLMYEIDDDAMVSLLPPALHPTIPPTLVFNVTRVPDSPVGAFLLAEVRVGCRAGARPRGFCARAYCDSDDAIAALGQRWGYPLRRAAISLEKRYDRLDAVVETDRVVLDLSLINPDPVSGNDIQYLPSLNLARVKQDGSEQTRLIQVDPDYAFRSADRGKPHLETFDAAAWELGGARPYWPISASYTTVDITMPALRYIIDPAKPPLAAVQKVSS